MKKLSQRKKRWIERTVANDRNYKSFLYNRFLIFAILVLLQMAGYAVAAFLLVYASAWGFALQGIIFILELVFLLYIINKNDRPSTRLNWILLILILPVIGVPMYLVCGEGRPAKKLRRRIERAKTENREKRTQTLGEMQPIPVEERGDTLCNFLLNIADYPVYTDGEVTYYKSGEEMFPEMLKELKKAEKFILFEYFIIKHGKMWNEIRKILLEKAMAGVQIRIIYDDFGCMMTLPPDYDRYLESLHENIKCMTFNEVVPFFAVRMNNRDHRKIIVIDGKTAFTGGINIADEYIGEVRRFGHWKDSGVKITGEAVASFTQMFFYMWNGFRKDKEDLSNFLLPIQNENSTQVKQDSTLRIQPYDDCPLDKISTAETVYADIVNRAKKYVYIFTPYLVLDDYLRSTLCQAALRGVDVRVVTPGIPDKKMIYRLTRANYGILLDCGVKIYEYTPGFIHAKSIVSDDDCAVVGTINFDYRSLYLHFENAVYFSGCNAVLDVKRDCEETFLLSKECTRENSKRSVVGKLVDSLLRIFETLF